MPEQQNSCPCAGRCNGCQCPCPDCTSVRIRRSHELRIECTRCHESRPESDYAVRSNGRRQSWCRPCHAEHARQSRATGSTRRRTPRATHADSRTFGVEIEAVFSDRYAMAQAITDAGYPCRVESYGHAVPRHWKIVDDGSVNGYEVVSPILSGEEGKRAVRRVMRAMRAAGARIDATCGLHVHHGADDLTAGAMYRLVTQWRDAQDAIDGLVAPSRRDGGSRSTWCRRLTSDDVTSCDLLRMRIGENARIDPLDASYVFGGARDGYYRYRTLNFRVFSLHGTVEIRQHQGTLNATKATAWIEFGQAMIERAIAGDASAPLTVGELIDELESHGLTPTSAAYLADRAESFINGSAVA